MASAIERVLSSLNDAGVRYVVVGGVAVVLHGHLRTTADLDLVVDLRPVALDETAATVIGLEDLIALKQRVNRPRDVEDVGALQALLDRLRGEERGGHG